jgi:UDP-N-acetylglucosamine 3-dehydrogenase
MLRVGVIGLGLMGRNHLRVYSEMNGVHLAAVADFDTAVLEQVQRGRTLHTYADYREMLDREDLDAVSIVVPTSEHWRVAVEAINRHIAVLIEKPIALRSVDAIDLIDRAASANVPLAVGHIERFNPAITTLCQCLAEGRLGRVFELKARRTGPFPDRVKDVGVVIDLATHDVDVMLKVTGADVARVACETTRNIHTEHEDTLLALLRFSEGTIGSLDVNWLSPSKTRDLTIIGERGMFVVDYLTQQLSLYENGTVGDSWEHLARLSGVSEGRVIRLVTSRTEPLRAELTSFVGSVENDTPPEVSGEDGLRALLLAEALLEASESGTVVNPVLARQPVLAAR